MKRLMKDSYFFVHSSCFLK